MLVGVDMQDEGRHRPGSAGTGGLWSESQAAPGVGTQGDVSKKATRARETETLMVYRVQEGDQGVLILVPIPSAGFVLPR